MPIVVLIRFNTFLRTSFRRKNTVLFHMHHAQNIFMAKLAVDYNTHVCITRYSLFYTVYCLQ